MDMTTPIRWGVLGTGAMAAAFVRELSSLPDARVEAVGSRDTATAAAFAERLGIPRHYGSYREVADDPNIDVVFIATVNPTHCELCLLCLDAGKPVLCEKPFTVNATEARRVVERARARGLFCMEAMWMRFLPAVSKLKQLIKEGVIGTPQMLSAQIGYPFVADPAGRQFNPALGGGALLDLGVYPISLAYYLFGPPESVIGRATITMAGIDDSEAILLRHSGGKLSVISVSLVTATPNEAVVMGTGGHIRLHEPFYRLHHLSLRKIEPIVPMSGNRDGRLAKLKNAPGVQFLHRHLAPLLTALRGRGTRQFRLPPKGEGYRYEAIEVMRCLRAREMESPIMPLDETVRILETLDELRKHWG